MNNNVSFWKFPPSPIKWFLSVCVSVFVWISFSIPLRTIHSSSLGIESVYAYQTNGNHLSQLIQYSKENINIFFSWMTNDTRHTMNYKTIFCNKMFRIRTPGFQLNKLLRGWFYLVMRFFFPVAASLSLSYFLTLHCKNRIEITWLIKIERLYNSFQINHCFYTTCQERKCRHQTKKNVMTSKKNLERIDNLLLEALHWLKRIASHQNSLDEFLN